MPLELTERDSGALREFVGRVREDLGQNVRAVKLFGSKARGEFDVNLAHDVYSSPRVIEQAVFEHPVWRITPFVQALEREGVPL
jgi:hypothetical protein